MFVTDPHRRGIETQRRLKKHSMPLPARINTGSGLFDCVIDDISVLSARLTLARDADLPRDFVLILSSDGHDLRRCRTLWRAELKLGVEIMPERPENMATVFDTAC